MTQSPPRSVLTDPVFRVFLRDGASDRFSVPAILEAVDAGMLVDLPGMRAHQRAAVVTTFAIIRAALRLYMDDAAGDYEAAWREQVGEDAARICAPYGEVAFFQSPLLIEPHLEKSLDGADIAFADVRHEVKGAGDTGDAETWLYAIMGGMLRIYVKGNVSGCRAGNTVILAGDGVTIGSEILHLSEAYLSMRETDAATDLFPVEGKSAADHLVFLQPVSPDTPSIPARSLPYPFIEAPRALRLIETADPGIYCARQMTLKSPRIEIKSIGEKILDPHVPVTAEKPYRLFGNRSYDYRFISTALFAPQGGAVVSPVYSLSRPAKAIRLCALGAEMGKTLGYYESLLPIRNEKVVLGLGSKGASDRISQLADRAIKVTSTIQSKAIYPAALMMQETRDSDIAKAAAGSVTDAFRDAMEKMLPLWILDRAGEPASDIDGDLKTYAETVIPEAFRALDMADTAATTSSPRVKADAWNFFTCALSQGSALKDFNLMKHRSETATRVPSLMSCPSASIIGRIAIQMRQDPQIAKTLRTMSPNARSVAYWRLAQEFPFEMTSHDNGSTSTIDIILRGLGSISHDSKAQSFGTILANTGFPESRIDRLLMSSGETLRGLADEVVRFVGSRGIAKADWRSLSGLLIADAMEDEVSVQRQRRKLAEEFVRSPVKDEKIEAV